MGEQLRFATANTVALSYRRMHTTERQCIFTPIPAQLLPSTCHHRTCCSAASATSGILATWPKKDATTPYTTLAAMKHQMLFCAVMYACRPQPLVGVLNTCSASLGSISRMSSSIACKRSGQSKAAAAPDSKLAPTCQISFQRQKASRSQAMQRCMYHHHTGVTVARPAYACKNSQSRRVLQPAGKTVR